MWLDVSILLSPVFGERISVLSSYRKECAYDARLSSIQTTDPLARITQTVYDDLDLPSEITDALSQKTKFVNNGHRDMKKLTDARNHVYGRGSAKECASRSHGQTPLRRQTSRTVKDVNGTKTLFFNLGTDQLEKYDITTATASSTIYEPGIDRPLAELNSSGVATFYHQDWLGNVVLLSSATGAKTESYTYDVWGKVTAKDASNQPVATPQSRFLFTARESAANVDGGLGMLRAPIAGAASLASSAPGVGLAAYEVTLYMRAMTICNAVVCCEQ